jgi:uncharacterized protein with FMN-binding domain
VKRIVLWFLSTMTVVVLLFGYHTSTSGPDVSASPPAVVSGSAQASQSTSTKTSKASKTAATQTVTGSVAATQWGPVQVELTVESGSITDVSVLQYPNGNGRDAEINSYALPMLIQETLDEQSANIDMVSGATVTSTGYLQSLQSALDQAGL